MEWGEITFQVAMVIAVVTLIKKLSNDKLGQWCMLIAMGISFAIVFLAMAENFILLDFIKQSIYVGLGAAGVYNIANKIGTGG